MNAKKARTAARLAAKTGVPYCLKCKYRLTNLGICQECVGRDARLKTREL